MTYTHTNTSNSSNQVNPRINTKRREEKSGKDVCVSVFSNRFERSYDKPEYVRVAEQIGLNRKKCSRCGIIRLYGNWDIHHINGDHNDNCAENLTILCDHCHVCTTFGYASDEDGIVDEYSWEMDGVIMEDV